MASSGLGWLDKLNAVESQQLEGAGDATRDGALSDDIRAQLEAWTTVNFENDASFSAMHGFANIDNSAGLGSGIQPSTSEDPLALSSKAAGGNDPSPYAKRPFGHPNRNFSLERSFNTFDHTSAFDEVYAGLGLETAAVSGDASNGTTTLFDLPAASFTASASDSVPISTHYHYAPLLPSQTNASTMLLDTFDNGEPLKKKPKTILPGSPVADGKPSSSSGSITPPAEGAGPLKGALLTKAAILAAQLADLAAKKGRTPEEEAARQAELNRVAAEDDKRRRNTAASARFRVKKKQREQALEETVKGLNDRIDKLERDLEASKTENNFLRDLVIRKVGLSELAGPSGGRISGGQEGATGMGTL